MKNLFFKTIAATLLICFIAPVGFRVDGILITMQSFVIFVIAAIMGKRIGALSSLLYLLTGALGAPVFGGYTSGWEKLFGATAGFLWGFPLCAFFLGYLSTRQEANFFNYIRNFFLAHFLLIALGFVVLKSVEPGVLLFETFQKLIPGLLLKSILGGLLSLYVVRHFPRLRKGHGKVPA